MDNELYIDVRNRMQSLLSRPDVEALMTSQQESTNAAALSATSAAMGDIDGQLTNGEEQKQAQTTAATVTVKQEMFKIDDDDDEEDELEENKQQEKIPQVSNDAEEEEEATEEGSE